MKKTKMVAVLSALVLGLVLTSCGNPSSGSTPEVQKYEIATYPIAGQGVVAKSGITLSGTELSKTTEIAIIPQGKVAQIFMTDDSSWNTYYSGTDQLYKGAFLSGRKVQLSAFAMGAYEVTQKLYEEVMGSNPSSFSIKKGNNPATGETGNLRPVEYVSWYDAIVFCNKLSQLCGLNPCYKINNTTDITQWGEVPTSSDATWNAVECDITANGYRLPTEAEWEFAARGGDPTFTEWKKAYAGVQATDSTIYKYGRLISMDKALNYYAWYVYNSGSKTHEVGKKKPNALGLYDMSGNVWEWCYDWDNSDVTSSDSKYKNESGIVENPRGTSAAASYRVRRGGHWEYDAGDCSVSRRLNCSPYHRNYRIGFRLARSL